MLYIPHCEQDAAWLEPVMPVTSFASDRVWVTETGYVLFNDQFMLIPRQFSDYLYDLNTKASGTRSECMYVCMYLCMYVSINQTNRYILSLSNTDDINYANKTLSLCMYVCICPVNADVSVHSYLIGASQCVLPGRAGRGDVEV